MARNTRGTEAPMDYEWTSRRKIEPSWTKTAEDISTPRKRTACFSNFLTVTSNKSPGPHDDLNPSTTPFGMPQPPMFGSNQNIPFIFQQNPASRTPNPPPWMPPALFSPDKAFPNPPVQQEVNDVDMSEVSPNKADEPNPDPGTSTGARIVAWGGARRVDNARKKSRDAGGPRRRRQAGEEDEDDPFTSEEEDGVAPLTRNLSHHYTLNMPAPPLPQSDLPYILLGYLQFLFNLSLILLFLYVVVQFILTVQRDVEQRISEYSMDIVQDIAICALQYKNNLCATNAIPAMAQQCANWETCMNRDPAIVGRAKVGAELIAEVVNGFVEPISWKALAFTLTSLSFLTVFINSLLSLFRARHNPVPTAPSHQVPPAFPPAPYPPHQYGGGYLSPAPTPSWGRSRSRLVVDEDFQTPTRRRRLEGGGAVKVQ
ncbi:Nucleus export protein BRL1 [Hypsizygus marmoreus]|uniref:Nucleus export protein BRL1 n=1 Tax=Hypsizygus marmoreus TaxID=39966 RepID=A0A369KC49_HYPMA|nr:Nucleus export protein BRL1 [Hypsizygus marmoreus]